MQSLPTELLLEIFDLACVDNAVAARSLSLVSRRVHEASRPFRFRIISLYATTTNLQTLIHSMGAEHNRSPDMRPKCRHLFLECPLSRPCEPDTSTTLTFTDALTSTSLGERSSSAVFCYANSRVTENGWNQWAEYLSSLLSIVAQDLETFTLVAFPDLHGPIVLPCPFPELRELTIVARRFPLHFDPTRVNRTCFPSLRRFHLAPLGESEKTHEDLTTLAPHAPRLTHLRISRLPRLHNLTALIRLYGKEKHHTAFPDLERVLIQPIPPSEKYGPSMLYCDFVTRLWCSAQRARVPVYLIPRDVKLQGVDYQASVRKAKEEWEDRIGGGEGCWAVQEDWVNRSDVGHVVPWHLLIMG